jgi:tetratricopeptide (TPR) repeat protein
VGSEMCIRDRFKEGERLFLVQEFVDGKTFDQILTERQEQNQAFNELEVIQLLKDVLPVLQYIHNNRIIHRDLSPDNIMLCHKTDKPILIDFGVVNQRTETLASGAIISGGTTVGKQLYSPLEQITAGICYPNSDLYALAVTVLNLLTGKSPIELRDNYDGSWRWRKHINASDSFAHMIDKMLSPTSKERYQTAQEVLDELNKFTNSVPAGNSQHSLSKQDDRDRVFSSLLIQGGVATIAIFGGLFFWQAPNISGLCDALNNCSIDEDYPVADKDHKQAIKLNPNYPNHPNEAQTYYDQGLTDAELKNDQVAISNFSQAIKLNPSFAGAYNDRGVIYVKLKNYQAAIADFNQTIKLDPSFAGAYSNRGLAYTYLKEYQAAIADFNQTIKLNPDYADAYFNRGLTYVKLKNYPAAIADFNQTIKLDPSFAGAYNGRGIIYSKLKDYQAAIADYNQALKLDPGNIPVGYMAYTNIGLAQYEIGAIEEAKTQFQQAINLDNKLPEAQLALAVTLFSLGESEKAIAMAKTALSIDRQLADPEFLKENLWGEKLIADTVKLLSLHFY